MGGESPGNENCKARHWNTRGKAMGSAMESQRHGNVAGSGAAMKLVGNGMVKRLRDLARKYRASIGKALATVGKA